MSCSGVDTDTSKIKGTVIVPPPTNLLLYHFLFEFELVKQTERLSTNSSLNHLLRHSDSFILPFWSTAARKLLNKILKRMQVVITFCTVWWGFQLYFYLLCDPWFFTLPSHHIFALFDMSIWCFYASVPAKAKARGIMLSDQPSIRCMSGVYPYLLVIFFVSKNLTLIHLTTSIMQRLLRNKDLHFWKRFTNHTTTSTTPVLLLHFDCMLCRGIWRKLCVAQKENILTCLNIFQNSRSGPLK